MAQSYDKNSIETLDFREAVRLRVGMYLGSADSAGVVQALREIITNSIDEYTVGYGKTIEVEIDKTRFTVRDYARGVPFGERDDDGIDSMLAIYTLPHTGGKFSDKTYKFVAGQMGTGAKATALSSSYFKAVSFRNGEKATLELKDGNVTSFQKSKTKEKDGTLVIFEPSEEVFNLEPIHIDKKLIIEMLENWSFLSKGLEIKLNFNGEKHTFLNNNGIIDLIKKINRSPVHKTIIHQNTQENKSLVEVAFQWSKERDTIFKVFVNGLEIPDGGTPTTGAKTSLTRTVNNLSGLKISGDSVRKGLTIVVNCTVEVPSFANQTKSKVSNPELRGLADKAVAEGLRNFKENKTKEWEEIIKLLDKEQKAELAAERAREAILTAEKEVSQTRKKNLELPSKAVDATNKSGYREIFLTEGDSASAYLKSTRDPATQAVMPLRGKILNTYDLEFYEAYENQEVQDIFSLLGCGAGSAFNLKKLRYEKIIIASDGDEDGGHINLLLLALFLAHTPELIKQGYVYRVMPPFYRYQNKYFFSDEELNAFLAKNPNAEYTRYKGLGAMSEQEVEKYIMNDGRKLIQIKMEDLSEARELFDVFLGKNLERRRKVVQEGEWIND